MEFDVRFSIEGKHKKITYILAEICRFNLRDVSAFSGVGKIVELISCPSPPV